MALVTRVRWSFRGEDAGSVNSQSYWSDCDTRAEPVASSAAWGHRLYSAKPSYIGVTDWLLVRGRGEKPLDRHVDAARIRTQSSSKQPSVQPGDRAILYASVWQAIFGVADIVGDPEHDPSRSRWAWTYPIRSVAVVTDLNRAPPVEAAGIFPQSLLRHSHIRLTEEQFDAARKLIEAAV
jgi:hypothetical protein